jgi:mRNA-degrading endonuclease toxin of MazEF toxin-antitoxin module
VSSAPPALPTPSQGEIWVVKLPVEPPDKGRRFVVVVSSDAQNHHPRATTVLVVPLSTTLSNAKRLQLKPGETGLAGTSEVWANGITTVRKADILPPRSQLRKLSRATVCEIMKHVILSVGILPDEIAE